MSDDPRAHEIRDLYEKLKAIKNPEEEEALKKELVEKTIKETQEEIYLNARKGIFVTPEEKQEMINALPELEKLDYLDQGLTPKEKLERRMKSQIMKEKEFYELTGIRNRGRDYDFDRMEAKYLKDKQKFETALKKTNLKPDKLYMDFSDSDPEYYDNINPDPLDLSRKMSDTKVPETLKEDTQ
jgi:hypothetical protein